MRESIKAKRERAAKIIKILSDFYPDAGITLDFNNAYELLVAVILAAQCTDARVNLVTPALFQRFPDPESLAVAAVTEVEALIRSVGLYHNKAKNLVAMANMLITEFGGEVPSDFADLLKLPGVGRKIANLMMGDYFGGTGIVVDTHCKRISKRFGFTKETDPTKVEFDLLKIVPTELGPHYGHLMVRHGREICKAVKPKCDICPVAELCREAKR